MKGRASLEKLDKKRASDNSNTLARETPALRPLAKPRGEARGDAPKYVPKETPEPETPRFKGDVHPLVLGGIKTEAPKRAYIELQEQLYSLDQKLSAIMEERRKEATELKKRIEIQNQEAKIMADKDKNMLNIKINMEMDMEKDAQRRMKELKTNISKMEAQTKNFEKSIEVLTKKRRSEEAQKGKQLDALMTKENQVRLKREQAEAALTSLDLVQKQKMMQKSLIQKQLLRLESGIEEEEPEEEPEEEEEEEEEVIEIPPPPLPDIPEQPEIICEDPCRDICNMVRCMDENFTKPCMPNPRQYCQEPCITNYEARQYPRPCMTNCEPREYPRPCMTNCEPREYPRSCIPCEPREYPRSCIPCEPILPVRCDPNHPICSNVPCDPYVSTFNLIKVLRRGYFAEVALVKSALTNNMYVIKSICKKENISKICRMKTVFSILAEHKHPFVVSMHDVIQDDNRIHFVMEYLSNGNLKEHLKRFTVFDESEAVFFSACALLAIEHLHSLDIAHRDIKLDNLVVDGCGYVKIVDFDLAIPYVMYNTPLYDKSGTSIYKCPEFFKPCEFTTRAADFWALGVVIHALLTAKCINTKPCLRLAEERLSAQAEDLLASMLNLVPSQRLGYSVNGGRAIMKHVFYKDIDWTALYQKRLHPPKRFLTKYWKDYSENETYRNRSFYVKPPL